MPKRDDFEDIEDFPEFDEKIDFPHVVKKIRKSRATLELEARGWRVWLPTMGPRTFVGEFAWFHVAYWDWLWPLLRAKQRGESIAGFDTYLSYLLTLGRGNAKSSLMEWSAIAAGALIGPMAIVYTSSTEGLASEHLTAIQHRVESSQFEKYYPTMATARVGKYGSRAGWNKNVLKTDSGLTVYAVGLNQDVRGLKDLDLRIGMEIFDDFDGRDDSPDVVEKKEGQIGGTILPMGTPETINVMGQNIIHENSVMNRIVRRHSPLLSHRKESGIIPAFSNVEIEQQGDRHVIVSGSTNWRHFNMQAAQKFLDDSGPVHWYAEYQHQFDLQKQGLVLSNYRDEIHVITWSEFERVFGYRYIPDSWNKYMANDWAKTKTQYHANVVPHIAVSDQNTPLPGRIFMFNLLTFEPRTEPDDVGLAMLKSITPTVPKIDFKEFGSWDDLMDAALNRQNLERYVSNTTALIEAKHEMLARIVPPYARAAIAKRNYKALRMSHEAIGPRQVYERAFGLNFDPVNPGKSGGAELINYYLKIDEESGHPFRPGVLGDTHFFLVVADDAISPPSELKPDSIHGMQLARYQFAHCQWIKPKLTAEGIEEKQGPQKLNDDVCFVAGTQITTSAGLVSIENVQIGDLVLTRDGMKAVTATSKRDNQSTLIMRTSDGRRLQGTPDHPIWVKNKDWIPLRDVDYNDELCVDTTLTEQENALITEELPSTEIPPRRSRRIETTLRRRVLAALWALRIFTMKYGKTTSDRYPTGFEWNINPAIPLTIDPTIFNWCLFTGSHPRSLITRELDSIDTRIRKSGRTGHISRRISGRDVRDSVITTSKSGKTLGARFHRGMLFITEITIPSIMISLILSASRNRITHLSMLGRKWRQTGVGHTCKEFRLSRMRHIWQFANGVAMNTRADHLGADIAPRDVSKRIGPVLNLKTIFAKCAERLLCRFGRNPCSARRSAVESISIGSTTTVYNLQVAEQPEYFANGILVHNCNALMMLFYDNLPRARELTHAEKIEQAIPLPYRYSEMVKTSPNGIGLTPGQEFALAFQTAEAKKRLGNSGQRTFNVSYD